MSFDALELIFENLRLQLPKWESIWECLGSFPHTPKFLVRPKKGPIMLKSGNSWNLVSLPASNTKGGERAVLKAPGLD
jgi:hypothetical protein